MDTLAHKFCRHPVLVQCAMVQCTNAKADPSAGVELHGVRACVDSLGAGEPETMPEPEVSKDRWLPQTDGSWITVEQWYEAVARRMGEGIG